jgi:hypothetical protein
MTKRIVTVAMVVAVLLAGLTTITAQKVFAGSKSHTVLLVHGFNAGSIMDCNKSSEFGTLESFLFNNGFSLVASVGFYNADYDCNEYLAGESSHCTGWYDSGNNDGTVNEDIRHTTCLLAWFIWDYWTSHGNSIEVIAHSMGGILIRQAMIDTPYVTQFPPYLYISDVATAGSPHQGISSGSAFISSIDPGIACPGNCVEIAQMEQTNAMMSNMNSKTWRSGFGRDPQGSGGTDWTTMSSDYDDVLNPSCDLGTYETLGAPMGTVTIYGLCGLMPGATHFVDYPGSSPKYTHGGYLVDTNTTWNADECYSDNNGGTWYCVTNSEHSLYTLMLAVLDSTW